MSDHRDHTIINKDDTSNCNDSSNNNDHNKSGHHNPILYDDLKTLFDTVTTLSRDILLAIDQDNTAVLTQLLMKRGKLIDRITTTDMDRFTEAEKFDLQQCLTRINEMEPCIQDGLRTLTEKVEKHLQGTAQQRQAIHQYKIPPHDVPTRENRG